MKALASGTLLPRLPDATVKAAEPAGEEKPAAPKAAAAGDGSASASAAPAPKKILKKKPEYSMKKGQIVRVDKDKYLNSIDVLDVRIFETGEYALIAWVGNSGFQLHRHGYQHTCSSSRIN